MLQKYVLVGDISLMVFVLKNIWVWGEFYHRLRKGITILQLLCVRD